MAASLIHAPRQSSAHAAVPCSRRALLMRHPTLAPDGSRLGLTQLELRRVDATLAKYIDEGLREAVRRLVGRGPSSGLSPEPLAIEARAACARYLEVRIQSTHEQKPGRAPDMSAEAAAALLAVLREVADAHWEMLHLLIDARGIHPNPEGVAQEHAVVARHEIVTKVLNNHHALLHDVCNPRARLALNIVGSPLTQLELQRVDCEHAQHVDQGMREAIRRLIGHGQPIPLDSSPAARAARSSCVRPPLANLTGALPARCFGMATQLASGRVPPPSPDHLAGL